MAACCNTALVVQCIVIVYAKSASAAAVTRYQASLRSPHNALHSPSYVNSYDYVCVAGYLCKRGQANLLPTFSPVHVTAKIAATLKGLS